MYLYLYLEIMRKWKELPETLIWKTKRTDNAVRPLYNIPYSHHVLEYLYKLLVFYPRVIFFLVHFTAALQYQYVHTSRWLSYPKLLAFSLVHSSALRKRKQKLSAIADGGRCQLSAQTSILVKWWCVCITTAAAVLIEQFIYQVHDIIHQPLHRSWAKS